LKIKTNAMSNLHNMPKREYFRFYDSYFTRVVKHKNYRKLVDIIMKKLFINEYFKLLTLKKFE